MLYLIRNYFPLLIVLSSFMLPDQTGIPLIGNNWTSMLLSLLILLYGFYYRFCYFSPDNRKEYLIIAVYLIWLFISVFRGVFVADNFDEYVQLISGTMALLLPLFVYVFSDKELLQKTLRLWFYIALPLFLYFAWKMYNESFQFYLGPVLFIGCFLPLIPKKWRFIIFALLILMVVADFFARSQVLKALIALCVSIGSLFAYKINQRIFHAVHRLLYIVPIVLLLLGITGVFNIFHFFAESYKGGPTNINTFWDEWETEESLSDDTRSFIYYEVITSAVKHNYVIQGRTPARGNDSESFGYEYMEILRNGRYERHGNEVCHPNVFTWLGLIGLILYGLIYYRSSYLALFKSNSIWLKLIGLIIAFRFFYGWIEDKNRLNLFNISLWMMIAMGFSETFRQMTDEDFKDWVVGIFKKNENIIEK